MKLTWIEFLFRILPETFIYMWGIHVICGKSFNKSKNIFLWIVLSILTFFVRWLPIYFGVHMIINIILTISIMAIAGIPIIKSIYGSLIFYFVLSLGEFFNIILLKLFNINTDMEVFNPFIKCLLGVPSLIILVLFIIIFQHVLKRKGKINDVYN